MNYTLFVCMDSDNTQKYLSQQTQFKKFMFSLGLDDFSVCFINELLGVEYSSFGQGTKIFIEDYNHKASEFMLATKSVEKYNENLYFNIAQNVVVIRYFEVDTKQVAKFVQDKLNLKCDYHIIKTFGLSKKTLCKYFESIKNTNNCFDYLVTEDCLDASISIRFYSTVKKIDIDNLIQKFTIDLKDFYYSDRDITLSNAVFELLSLQKLKIATAESFTCGLIANTIVSQNAGASAILKESYIVYSDEAKHNILGVSNNTLKNFTAVSQDTAFEMAVGLLDITDADIVIATTGYANHTNKELSGLFFTAIGDSVAVNVRRYKFNGNRLETIKYGTNVALFETIKKIRQNALKKVDFVV